jgi:hypothetical protein
MLNLRRLIGLAVVFGAFLVIVAPALAEFQSLPTKSQLTSGKIIPLSSAVFVFHNPKGEVFGEFACRAEGMSGTWKIRSTGKFLEEIKGPSQRETKRGPHLQLEISWEKAPLECIAGAAAITVEPCVLQLHQIPGEFSVAGDIVSGCAIELRWLLATCKIEVPQGNESTGENFQLRKTDLSNSGSNQREEVNIASITQKVTGKLCPLETNKTMQVERFEFEAEGVNAV